MVASDTVTVYAFRIIDDGHTEMARIAPYKATRGTIERLYTAEVIEGTAEQVDPEDLDDAGHYRRLPTGWGSLS